MVSPYTESSKGLLWEIKDASRLNETSLNIDSLPILASGYYTPSGFNAISSNLSIPVYAGQPIILHLYTNNTPNNYESFFTIYGQLSSSSNVHSYIKTVGISPSWSIATNASQFVEFFRKVWVEAK